MTIGWLLARMEDFQSQTALVWKDRPVRYGELLEQIRFWRDELRSSRFQNTRVFCLEADFSPPACALLLSLIEAGKIVVPLTAGARTQRDEFMEIAEVQAVFSFSDEDRWDVSHRNVDITNPITSIPIEQGRPGLVLFSSGSTGKPKAALHDFLKIMEKFKVSRRRMCTLSFLLFDHIGGVNTLFYTFSNGGTLVGAKSRDPESVCELIQDHKVELLPTTPTFLNMLLITESYRHFDLSSLKLITYGTEMMSDTVLKRLSRIFPKAEILQTYGLSEVGILRSKSKSSNSLWVKVGGEGYETKVVDGILWIRSESAMVGYLNAPSPFTEDGWFVTGDVVESDGDYLRFKGRDSDIINVGGEKVYPAEVESVLLSMPGIEDAAVVGQANPIMGNIVTARVRLANHEPVSDLRLRIRKFCRDKLPKFKIPQKVEIVDEKMHNERFKKIR
jgi:acyl-coenzyme A synthetase/AMP-(fatty) acid ligase